MAKVKINVEGVSEFQRKLDEMNEAVMDSMRDAIRDAARDLEREITMGKKDRKSSLGINDRDAIEGEYEVVDRRPMLGDGNE